jgi:SSS family solute:Na+ symporter
VPFSTLFTGVLLLNMFYWTTNQQIIQRTFGAASLAEGQKGVLMTGLLKLLGPLYLVLPGLMAFAMFPNLGADNADQAYGLLVNAVLPAGLAGFFAAAMMGAILSSYNSALNSTCTLFSLGVYQGLLKPNATEAEAVKAGKWFGWILSVFAMTVAPLLIGQDSIFGYLQKMNGIYFIPIFAVVLCGMTTRRVPSLAAKLALVIGPIVIACGYFIPVFARWVDALHEYHFLGIVFVGLFVMMLVVGRLDARAEPWMQQDVHAVDMRPWRFLVPAAVVLCVVVVAIYWSFADFS